MGSGLATDYAYYPWTQSGGRLARLQTGALQDLRYGYDAVGNVTRIEDYKAGAPEVQSFGYDSLDRLTGVSGAYTETYAYAANGNLINKAGVDYSYSAPVSGCSAGTLGAKPHAVAQAGSRAYSYDCNGNMTERAGQVLRYGAENRLTQVIGEAVTAYRYNGDGQRVTLTTGCTTTTYVGNYFEWTGSAATMTSYYYAGGTRVAMRTGTPITGTVNYLLGDHLGSSSVSYRADGNQTVTQRYYPWGSVRATTGGALPTDYGFTGQKLDVSAGLLYYGARYYDSALGRFIQADTIVPQPGNPQALNRYSYVLNRPTVYRDPTGHAPAWLNYVSGAVSQYMNDMTFGLWSALAVPGGNMDFIPSDTYQQGRELGRSASTAQAQFEVATGIGMAVVGTAALAPTLTGGAVCTLATGGACALAAAPAVAIEGGMVVAGAAAALHGGGVLLYAKEHPVGSKGGGSAQYKKLTGHEVDMLEKAGYDVHDLKGGKRASKYDLYKDKDGNIYQKPKDGTGPGEELGININDLTE